MLDKATPKNLEQLALDLNLEEAPELERVSVQEARLRSMAARQSLNSLIIPEPKDGESARNTQWLEAFDDLLDYGWPWRLACYIAWAASPKITRWPETQDQLAREVLGLNSDRVIATWRKKNPTIDRVIALMQAAPMMERRADAFAALGKSASDPDHRHNPDRRLYFEMSGDYVPRAKLDVTDKTGMQDLSNLSDAELEELAGQVGLQGKINRDVNEEPGADDSLTD